VVLAPVQLGKITVSKLYQKGYWEGGRNRRLPSHPVIKAFAEPKVHYINRILASGISRKFNKMTLLDVGCGNGFFTYYFEPIYDTYGIDYSEFMLSINPCKKRVCGSATDLPFAENSFDIVFCSNLLHHLEEPIDAVREMRRVSRKYVVLSEPNRNNLLMFMFGFFKTEERGTLKFSMNFMKKLFLKCGLEFVEATTMGIIGPNKTPAYLLPILKFLDGRCPLGFYNLIIGEKD